MTDKQPEALTDPQLQMWAEYCAMKEEVARLHEVNAELVEALRLMKLEKGFVCDCGIEDPTWDLIEAIQEKIDGSH